MKWFLIGIAMLLVAGMIAITASEKVAASMWEKVGDLEGPYPSEEFDDLKYGEPEKFAVEHGTYLEQRSRIIGFSLFMTDYAIAETMNNQLLEMYLDSPLEDRPEYMEAEFAKLQILEKRGWVDQAIEYGYELKERYEYSDIFPYKEELNVTLERLNVRKMQR